MFQQIKIDTSEYSHLISSIFNLHFFNQPMFVIKNNYDYYIVLQSVNYIGTDKYKQYVYNDILYQFNKISNDDDLNFNYMKIYYNYMLDFGMYYTFTPINDLYKFNIQLHGRTFYSNANNDYNITRRITRYNYFQSDSMQHGTPDVKFLYLNQDSLTGDSRPKSFKATFKNNNELLSFENDNYTEFPDWASNILTKYYYNFIVVLRYNVIENKLYYVSHINHPDIENFNYNNLYLDYNNNYVIYDSSSNIVGIKIKGSSDSTQINNDFTFVISSDTATKIDNYEVNLSDNTTGKEYIFNNNYKCDVSEINEQFKNYSIDNINTNIKDLFPIYISKNINGDTTTYNILYNIYSFFEENVMPFVLHQIITKNQTNVNYSVKYLKYVAFINKSENGYIVGFYKDNLNVDVFECDILVKNNSLIFNAKSKIIDNCDIYGNFIYYNNKNNIFYKGLYTKYGWLRYNKYFRYKDNDYVHFPFNKCAFLYRDITQNDIISNKPIKTDKAENVIFNSGHIHIYNKGHIYQDGLNIKLDNKSNIYIHFKINLIHTGIPFSLINHKGKKQLSVYYKHGEYFYLIDYYGNKLKITDYKYFYNTSSNIYIKITPNYIKSIMFYNGSVKEYTTLNTLKLPPDKIDEFRIGQGDSGTSDVYATSLFAGYDTKYDDIIYYIVNRDINNDNANYILNNYTNNNFPISYVNNHNELFMNNNVAFLPNINWIIPTKYNIKNNFFSNFNECNSYAIKVNNIQNNEIICDAVNIFPDDTSYIIEFRNLLKIDNTNYTVPDYENLYDFRDLTYDRLLKANNIYIKELKDTNSYFKFNDFPLFLNFKMDINEFIKCIDNSKFIHFDSTNITYNITYADNTFNNIPTNKNEIVNFIDSLLQKNKITINELYDVDRYQNNILVYTETTSSEEIISPIYMDGTDITQKVNIHLNNNKYTYFDILSTYHIDGKHVALPIKYSDDLVTYNNITYNIYKTKNNFVNINIKINGNISDYKILDKGRYAIQKIPFRFIDISNITSYDNHFYDTTDVINTYISETQNENLNIIQDTSTITFQGHNSDDTIGYAYMTFNDTILKLNNNVLKIENSINYDYNEIENNVFNNVVKYNNISFILREDATSGSEIIRNSYLVNINSYNNSVSVYKIDDFYIKILSGFYSYGYFYDVIDFIYAVDYYDFSSESDNNIVLLNLKQQQVDYDYKFTKLQLNKPYKYVEYNGFFDFNNKLPFIGFYGNIFNIKINGWFNNCSVLSPQIDYRTEFNNINCLVDQFYYYSKDNIYDILTDIENICDSSNHCVLSLDSYNIHFQYNCYIYNYISEYNNIIDYYVYNNKLKERPDDNTCNLNAIDVTSICNIKFYDTLGEYNATTNCTLTDYTNNPNMYLGIYWLFNTPNDNTTNIIYDTLYSTNIDITNTLDNKNNNLTLNLTDISYDMTVAFNSILKLNRGLNSIEKQYLDNNIDKIFSKLNDNINNVTYYDQRQGHQLSNIYKNVEITPIISGNNIILSVEKDIYKNTYNIVINGIKIASINIQNKILTNIGIHSLFVETNLDTNTKVSILNISDDSTVPIYDRKFNFSNYKNQYDDSMHQIL